MTKLQPKDRLDYQVVACNKIAHKNLQQDFEGYHCVSSSQTKTNMKRMSSFVSVTSKVTHLYHNPEWQ
jgi:hypothetical protein